MPDVTRPLTHDPGDRAFAIAERMSREVGTIAGGLARLLARSPLAADSPLAQGHAFLLAMCDAQTNGAVEGSDPAAGDRGRRGAVAEMHPLDRLAAQLSLAAAEVDLIVLAGMPEEHEGYASIMRSLNP